MVDPWRLVHDMRASTLTRWAALAEIDPWDDNRADLRAGEVAAASVNVQGAKKWDGAPFAPEDFMRYHVLQQDPDELERQHDAEVSAALRQWLLSNSGHVATKDRDFLKEED